MSDTATALLKSLAYTDTVVTFMEVVKEVVINSRDLEAHLSDSLSEALHLQIAATRDFTNFTLSQVEASQDELKDVRMTVTTFE